MTYVKYRGFWENYRYTESDSHELKDRQRRSEAPESNDDILNSASKIRMK